MPPEYPDPTKDTHECWYSMAHVERIISDDSSFQSLLPFFVHKNFFPAVAAAQADD